MSSNPIQPRKKNPSFKAKSGRLHWLLHASYLPLSSLSLYLHSNSLTSQPRFFHAYIDTLFPPSTLKQLSNTTVRANTSTSPCPRHPRNASWQTTLPPRNTMASAPARRLACIRRGLIARKTLPGSAVLNVHFLPSPCPTFPPH
jgi:hypothetical protein